MKYNRLSPKMSYYPQDLCRDKLAIFYTNMSFLRRLTWVNSKKLYTWLRRSRNMNLSGRNLDMMVNKRNYRHSSIFMRTIVTYWQTCVVHSGIILNRFINRYIICCLFCSTFNTANGNQLLPRLPASSWKLLSLSPLLIYLTLWHSITN